MKGFTLTQHGKKEAFRQFAEAEGHVFLGKLHGDSLAIQRNDNDEFELLIIKDGNILVRTEFHLGENSTVTIEGIDVTTGVSVE